MIVYGIKGFEGERRTRACRSERRDGVARREREDKIKDHCKGVW